MTKKDNSTQSVIMNFKITPKKSTSNLDDIVVPKIGKEPKKMYKLQTYINETQNKYLVKFCNENNLKLSHAIQYILDDFFKIK